jgi:hypothetical protein
LHRTRFDEDSHADVEDDSADDVNDSGNDDDVEDVVVDEAVNARSRGGLVVVDAADLVLTTMAVPSFIPSRRSTNCIADAMISPTSIYAGSRLCQNEI